MIEIDQKDKDSFDALKTKKVIGLNVHTAIFASVLFLGFSFCISWFIDSIYEHETISTIGEDIDVRVGNDSGTKVVFSRYHVYPNGALSFTIRDGLVRLYSLRNISSLSLPKKLGNDTSALISGTISKDYPLSWGMFDGSDNLESSILEFPSPEDKCSYSIKDNISRPNTAGKFSISFLPKNKNGSGVTYIKDGAGGWFVFAKKNLGSKVVERTVFYCESSIYFLNNISAYLSAERL